MTVFQKAIQQIFNCKDFIEKALIGSEAFDVICTPLTQQLVYSQAGLVDDVNFRLSLKLPLRRPLKVGQKVKFRQKNYKILSIETDSANTSVYVTLQSMSKG